MLESVIALALFFSLIATATLYALLPWHVAFGAGAWLAAVGLVLGVPTGIIYHLQLFRCLGKRGELARRWWLDPIAQHVHLRPEERLRVLSWCALGALGFLIAMTGCAVLVAGVMRAPYS